MNGGIFFYSLNGDGSLEWLGSAMIWLLIGMSVANIVMISLSVGANRRATLIAPGAVDGLRGLLSSGRYKDAIERAEAGTDDF